MQKSCWLSLTISLSLLLLCSLLDSSGAEARKRCRWKCMKKHKCYHVYRSYLKTYCTAGKSRCYTKSVFGRDPYGERTIRKKKVCIKSPKRCVKRRYNRRYRICGSKKRCFRVCGSHTVRGGSGPCGMNKKEAAVLRRVNRLRSRRKLGKLKCNANVVSAARKWSYQQCKKKRLSHANMATRIMEAAPNASSLAENVFAGTSSPRRVMRYWMRSSAHRRNILTPEFNFIGIGYVRCRRARLRHVWTQMFYQ